MDDNVALFALDAWHLKLCGSMQAYLTVRSSELGERLAKASKLE